MPRGENVINMTVEAEFLQAIRKQAGNRGQYDNTFLGSLVLEVFLKNGWMDKAMYDRLMKNHWGLTMIEQRNSSDKKSLEEKEKKALDTATKAKQAEADLIKAKAYFKQVNTTQENREWEIIDNLVWGFKEGMKELNTLPKTKDKVKQLSKIRAILDKLAKIDPKKASELEGSLHKEEEFYKELGDKKQ